MPCKPPIKIVLAYMPQHSLVYGERNVEQVKTFGRRRKIFHFFSVWMSGIAAFLATALGLVNGIDDKEEWLKSRPVVARCVEFVQENAIWLYAVIIFLVLISEIYKRFGDPWVWEKIKFILDEYQGKAFNVNGATPADHNRVTLFKYTENCIFKRHWSSDSWYRPGGKNPLFSSYLLPVLRSGHMSQKTKAMFYAPDSSDKAEGIAAFAWASRQAISVPGLPQITSKANKSERKQYAEATFSDIKMIEKYALEGRPMPRSITAIPIESSGSIWGVVVLDSRSPNGVSDNAVEHYRLTVALVGHLLERA